MTSGLDGATATAPTDEVSSPLSVTGFHVVPPSTAFHSPPPVAPKKYSSGRASLPETVMDRPPRFGPRSRHFRPARNGSPASRPSSAFAPAAFAATAVGACVWACATALDGSATSIADANVNQI